jgi:hypothetical protein
MGLVLGVRRRRGQLGLGRLSLRPMGVRAWFRLVLGARRRVGAGVGELALRRPICRLGTASAGRIAWRVRGRTHVLDLCAWTLSGSTRPACLLRAGLSPLCHPAHDKYRQSDCSGAWGASRGQPGNPAGLCRTRERSAGCDLPRASARLRFDTRRVGRGANQSRRVASSASGRPAWSPRWPRTARHHSTPTPASCFHRAHHNSDSAERVGHCAAASRQK